MAIRLKVKNKLRLIGGIWRSRYIYFVDAPGLRPTPARVRETLFNWLQNDIVGSRCLDLYAGSGALGFEAASRGAKLVVQVEKNAQACKSLKENTETLAADQITIINMDVSRYLAQNAKIFDLVFLDPPFSQNLAAPTCQSLEQHGWLKHGAKIYVETESHPDLSGIPDNWKLLKSKKAGEVGYHLFERSN